MSTRKNKFLKGIQIIGRNAPNYENTDADVHVEHDQIWFGDEKWVTDPIDIAALEKLGWFIDEESWSCFV